MDTRCGERMQCYEVGREMNVFCRYDRRVDVLSNGLITYAVSRFPYSCIAVKSRFIWRVKAVPGWSELCRRVRLCVLLYLAFAFSNWAFKLARMPFIIPNSDICRQRRILPVSFCVMHPRIPPCGNFQLLARSLVTP
jgi:hypothetical protein